MTKSILNTIHRKITELSQKHPYLFLDFLADHIGDASFQWFVQLLPEKTANITYQELALRLFLIVSKKKKNWQKILHGVLKNNATYIENSGYHKLSIDELKKEFAKEEVPSIVGTGVAPEMMIMYLLYKRRFSDPMLPFLLEEYKKVEEKIKEAESNIKDPHNLNVPEKIKGTMFEDELKSFVNESTAANFPSEDEFKKLARDNGFEYIPEKKQFVVPRGLILFLFSKLEDIKEDKIILDKIYRILLKSIKDVNEHGKRLAKLYKKFKDTIEENSSLKRELRLLKKKLSEYEKREEHLKNRLRAVKEQDKDSIIMDLQKQLNYAYSRIEKLERKIEELEEAKKINREIEENIKIEDKTAEIEQKPIIEEGSFIVISGGKWNSKTKEEIEAFFEKFGCAVEFVPAEDTIKKQDLIANADLVIFDTSKHAHKYYYKVKQSNSNVIFINKSNFESVKSAISQ